VTDQDQNPLSDAQLSRLQSSLHSGSANASEALAGWIEKQSVVEIDSLDQLQIEDAATTLGGGEEPICYCSMHVDGVIAGEIILVFDDESGFALADMLLDQRRGTTIRWTEMTTSAALETTNILCCAYLNALSHDLSTDGRPLELVPKPPRFNREFAESLMQFALMGQTIAFDKVILGETRFRIDGATVNWTLLFIPDAESMSRLAALLDGGGSRN
jgi:chemotaxis protein CheC